MRFILNLLTFLFCLLLFPTYGQVSNKPDTLLENKGVDSLLEIPQKPMRASGLILGTNMAIWLYDNFIARADYARVNINSIRSNLKTGFVWDNDVFICNLFSHPYNGGLYFNAARFNGMNFWQSVPFTAVGSLVWEFFLENEPASINDFITTTIGGTCLGEMTFRISDMILDDRSIGFDRVKREVLLTIISPLRGLNRIINGDAWKHRRIRGNSLPLPPFVFYGSVGLRMMKDFSTSENDLSNMARLDLGLAYGNVFDPANERPYDSFTLRIGCNFFSSQPVFNEVSAIGTLFSKNITLSQQNQHLVFGIFQHFNYYEAGADTVSEISTPFRISEAVAAGSGLLYKAQFSNEIYFSCAAHLSGILLGACQTDYYKYRTRYYSMGSGFSSKLNFELEFNNKGRLFLNTEYYRIFSWVGYNSNENANISMNVQGDVGNAQFKIIRFGFNYIIEKTILLSAEVGYYYRKNVYKYYPDVERSFEDLKLSIGYIFKN